MKADVTTQGYLTWRDKTSGCLSLRTVHYTMLSEGKEYSGALDCSEIDTARTKAKYYSSAVLAVLDRAFPDFKKLIESEEGSPAVSGIGWGVTAIDEAKNEVWVTGAVMYKQDKKVCEV